MHLLFIMYTCREKISLSFSLSSSSYTFPSLQPYSIQMDTKAHTQITQHALHVRVQACICVVLHHLCACTGRCWPLFYSKLGSRHDSSCNLPERERENQMEQKAETDIESRRQVVERKRERERNSEDMMVKVDIQHLHKGGKNKKSWRRDGGVYAKLWRT